MLNEGWYTGGRGLGALGGTVGAAPKGTDAPPPPAGGATVYPYSTADGGMLGRAIGPATPDTLSGSSVDPPTTKPRSSSSSNSNAGAVSGSDSGRNRAGSLAQVSSLFTDDFADKPAHLCMYDQGMCPTPSRLVLLC
jgi:hypothetical protein